MNKPRQIMASLKLLNSLFAPTHPLSSRVTHFAPFPSSSFPNPSNSTHFFKSHNKLFSTSTPNSIVQLIIHNDWSPDLERELEESNPKLTHETVIYVLKKIDKNPRKASSFFKWVCVKFGFKPSSAIYGLVLRTLLHEESMKEFWVTIREMSEQGFYIDEETYKTLLGIFRHQKMDGDAVALKHFYDRMVKENAAIVTVKNVVGVVMGSDWSDEVEKQLGGMKIALSDDLVIRVLKELCGYPKKAVGFFNWVGECPSFEHTTVTYNAIARVLGRVDSIGEFWRIVKEMKSAGHEMDMDSYLKVSRQFIKYKMMEDAVKLYEHMMDGPYKPSIQNCAVLLRHISSSSTPDLDLVFRVSKKYEETGHSLSKAVYDGIHRALTGLGKFDEAKKMMETMRNAGYEPDNITYSQMIFGLCKARRLEEACEMLDEMEEQGCVPDIKTWTILIQGHCAANEVEKAFTYFAKMITKECEADADLLDVLVKGFLSQKKVNSAYIFLVEMVNKARLRPWQATYKNTIEKLLEQRKFEEAMDLLRIMKKQNYPPFAEPFTQYISKFGTVEDAEELLKALSAKEYPSSSVYVNIFQSFFKEGRHSEAKDLLYKCPYHIRKHVQQTNLFGSAESGKTNA